jgi:hypothetical protein
MKQLLVSAIIGLCVFTDATAQTFDGYETYYATLPDRVFSPTDKHPLATEWTYPGKRRHVWNEKVDGRLRRVTLADNVLAINGRRFTTGGATRFPDETPGELGGNAALYVNKSHACVEGALASASGMASRHTQVYLVVEPFFKNANAYVLPSLFASCLGLRLDSKKRILFDEVAYLYAPPPELMSCTVTNGAATPQDTATMLALRHCGEGPALYGASRCGGSRFLPCPL